MCGICGEARFDAAPASVEAVTRMGEVLAPRGPDAAGAWSQGRSRSATGGSALDHELVEQAARVPAEHKVKGGGKHVLKEAARRVIPSAVIDRPKGYFPVPALKYIEGPYLAYVSGTRSPHVPRRSARCSTLATSALCSRAPRSTSRRFGARSSGRSPCSSCGCRPTISGRSGEP